MKNNVLIVSALLIPCSAQSAMRAPAGLSLRNQEHRMNQAHRNRIETEKKSLSVEQIKRIYVSMAVLKSDLPALQQLLSDSQIPVNLNHNEFIDDCFEYHGANGSQQVRTSPFSLLKGYLSPLEYAVRGRSPQTPAIVNVLLAHRAVPSAALCTLVATRNMHPILDCFLAHNVITIPELMPLAQMQATLGNPTLYHKLLNAQSKQSKPTH